MKHIIIFLAVSVLLVSCGVTRCPGDGPGKEGPRGDYKSGQKNSVYRPLQPKKNFSQVTDIG